MKSPQEIGLIVRFDRRDFLALEKPSEIFTFRGRTYHLYDLDGREPQDLDEVLGVDETDLDEVLGRRY